MKSDIICDAQHTCRKSPPAFLIYNAPFKASKKTHDKNNESIPFLGEGYYLWEENLFAAHRWGKRHYSKNYSIVEYKDLNLNGNNLLDLLDRKYSKYFKELISLFEQRDPKYNKFLLAQWIELFKDLHVKDIHKKTFPYLYIRADEHLPDSHDNENIRKIIKLSRKGYHTFLEPLIVICIINKNDIICSKKEVIY